MADDSSEVSADDVVIEQVDGRAYLLIPDGMRVKVDDLPELQARLETADREARRAHLRPVDDGDSQ